MQVQRAFGEIERTDALCLHLRRGTSGLLRVAATPSLASHLLPAAPQAMPEACPGVACDLWASHTAQIEQDLAAFEIDAGLRSARRTGDGDGDNTGSQRNGAGGTEGWTEGVMRLDDRAWFVGRPFVGLEATPLGERLAAALDQAKVGGVLSCGCRPMRWPVRWSRRGWAMPFSTPILRSDSTRGALHCCA